MGIFLSEHKSEWRCWAAPAFVVYIVYRTSAQRLDSDEGIQIPIHHIPIGPLANAVHMYSSTFTYTYTFE